MEEERILLDLARRAERIGHPLFTDFLDPVQAALAERCAHEAGTSCALWGGYPDAERQIACFAAGEDEPDWPLRWLECTWNAKFASPGHRDFLGALMGLGIKREALGDILTEESRAVIALHASVADYVYAELTSAGRASLTCSWADPDTMREHVRPLTEGEITVTSLRLDAVVAAGARLSRSAAERLIEQGGVKVDHVPELRPDKKLSEHCLLSITGYGRLYILGNCGTTKRGRMRIRIGRPN